MPTTMELVAQLQAVQDDPEICCDHRLTASIHDLLNQSSLVHTRSTRRGIEYHNGQKTVFVHRIDRIWYFGRLPH